MSRDLRISIVTPSFNQAQFLGSTIKSVLEQGYDNLEYILMDGGSTDGSQEVIRPFERRLAHWRSGPDLGQADAILQGFGISSGSILGWLNSDDLLLPGCLQAVASFFERHPEIDLLVGGSAYIDQAGRPILKASGVPLCNLGARPTFYKLLMWECGFNQPASFWRRDAFFDVGGFDRTLRFCFDYDLYLRLTRRKPGARIKRFLACFRIHPESKTTTLKHVRDQENNLLWRKYGRFSRPWPWRMVVHRLYLARWRLEQALIASRLAGGRLLCPLPGEVGQ